jgi:hypothetical protein
MNTVFVLGYGPVHMKALALALSASLVRIGSEL